MKISKIFRMLAVFSILFVILSQSVFALSLDNGALIDIDKPMASIRSYCGCTLNDESCNWKPEALRWIDFDVYYTIDSTQFTPEDKKITIDAAKKIFTIYLRVKNSSQFSECIWDTFEIGGNFALESTIHNIPVVFGDEEVKNILPTIGKFDIYDDLYDNGADWSSSISPPDTNVNIYDSNGNKIGTALIEYVGDLYIEEGSFTLTLEQYSDAYLYEIPINVDIHPFTDGNITFDLSCISIGSGKYSGCAVSVQEKNTPKLIINPYQLETLFDEENILLQRGLVEKDGNVFVKIYVDARSNRIDRYESIKGDDGNIPEGITYEILESSSPRAVFRNFPVNGEIIKGPWSFFVKSNLHTTGKKIIDFDESTNTYNCFYYLGASKGYSFLMMNSDIANTAYLEYIIDFEYKNYTQNNNVGYIEDSGKEGYSLKYQVPFSSSGNSNKETIGSSDNKSPGFETMFVIVAVGLLLYLMRKQKK